mmetsp:Transcript_20651/g.57399  ORF Transcript_20651/g.57399 Transcript_20651/m.57399 type:complete len:80 (+) Transcript_20651:182-421(+)
MISELSATTGDIDLVWLFFSPRTDDTRNGVLPSTTLKASHLHELPAILTSLRCILISVQSATTATLRAPLASHHLPRNT